MWSCGNRATVPDKKNPRRGKGAGGWLSGVGTCARSCFKRVFQSVIAAMIFCASPAAGTCGQRRTTSQAAMSGHVGRVSLGGTSPSRNPAIAPRKRFLDLRQAQSCARAMRRVVLFYGVSHSYLNQGKKKVGTPREVPTVASQCPCGLSMSMAGYPSGFNRALYFLSPEKRIPRAFNLSEALL